MKEGLGWHTTIPGQVAPALNIGYISIDSPFVSLSSGSTVILDVVPVLARKRAICIVAKG